MNYQGWEEQRYLKQAAPERRERVVVPYDDVMQTSCVMCAVTSVTDALRTRRAFCTSAKELQYYDTAESASPFTCSWRLPVVC